MWLSVAMLAELAMKKGPANADSRSGKRRYIQGKKVRQTPMGIEEKRCGICQQGSALCVRIVGQLLGLLPIGEIGEGKLEALDALPRCF